MSRPGVLPLPPAPGYGQGVARRRIRLTTTPGLVFAELEDHAHAMRCRLTHAGGRITGLQPDFHRIPLSTCPSAERPLAELVGQPIAVSTRAFFAGGRARRNCTHMFDLAWLASRQAARGEGMRLLEMDVPDLVHARTRATLKRDGITILDWRIDNDVIDAPAPFGGRDLYAGFVSWLLGEALEDDLIEAALVLQKACLVSSARRYTLPAGLLEAPEKRAAAGLCHGYAVATIDKVIRHGTNLRDFSENADDLLRFL